MTSMLPRSAWTSSKNTRNTPLNSARVTMIVCHYPATPGTIGKESRARIAERLRDWRDFHIHGNGWRDIGYNYAIDQAGRVWYLTGSNVGAHAGTIGNTQGVGVLFIVGNNEKPSPELVASFRWLRRRLRVKFPRATRVVGHQQVPGNSTACPGKPVMSLIRSGELTKSASAKPTRGTAYVVTASAVNVRSGPTTDSKVVKTLKRGRRFKVVGRQGVWLVTTRGRYVHSHHARKA